MSNSQICKITTLVVSFLLICQVSAAATFTLTYTSTQLNVLANYTWSINFGNTVDRGSIILKFPPEMSFTPTTNAYLNGNIATPITISSNLSNELALTSTTTIFSGTITIFVTDVINPYSVISGSGFQMKSTADGTVSLSSSFLTYTSGSFTSCPWTFNHCTEDINSDLIVKVTLVNRLPVGNNKFLISYPSQWPSLSFKNLITGSTSLSCSISLDGGTSFTPSNVSNVSYTLGSFQIIVTFTLASQLSQGQIFVVKVSGVNAPPTKETTTSDFFKVQTADGNSKIIDSGSRCQIDPVCVTYNIQGSLQNTSQLTVNSIYTNPQINFVLTTPITFQVSDEVEVYYTPIGNLAATPGCSSPNFKFLRNNSPWTITKNTLTTFYTFYFSSEQSSNTDYYSPLMFLFQCYSLTMPNSRTPVPLQLKFKRSSSYYLQLNTSIIAQPSLLNNMTGGLVLSTTEMGKAATFSYTFVSGQPLGSSPHIVIAINSDIGNGTMSCSVGISLITVTSSGCVFDITYRLLTISLTTGSIIPSGSTFTLTVNGLINPLFPMIYPFQTTTYYDSLSTSMVQTNSWAFKATYTAITNPPVDLLPISCSVYALTPITIGFVSPLNIPFNSTFKIQFPSEITHLEVTSTPLKIGVNNMTVTSLTNLSSILQFTTSAIITKGDNVLISLSILTPTIMKSYSFVKLIITNTNTIYLQSLSTMSVNVNSVSAMPATLISNNPIAGATSTYTLTLNLTIPHSTDFTVLVDLPTDVSIASTGNTCIGNCIGPLSSSSNTSFSFSATNPTNLAALSFTFGTFINPRSVGLATSWKITTRTITPVNVISIQYASATITTPNSLTGGLLLSESYYRNNSSPVKMSLSFTNQLQTNDYLKIQIAITTYTIPVSSALQCSALYGACTIFATNSTYLVIKVVPNLTSVTNRTLSLIIEGLLSNPNTSYATNETMVITSYNFTDCKMDTGRITYNISCREGSALSNNCKRCSINGSCIDCYLSYGYYFYNGVCSKVCPNSAFYPNSTTGICQPCTNNCATCTTSTSCLTCITSTTYYLYISTDNSCQLLCSNTTGFIVTTNTTGSFCITCSGYPLCLECTSSISGSCIRCNTTLATLSNGICINGSCSAGFYSNNGRCEACNSTCSTCTGPGNGNCINCTSGLFNFTGFCVDKCIDSALTPNTSNRCGCSSICLKCLTTDYYACTVCADPSKFVYQGNCTSACPAKTYLNSSTCISCSSGCQNCTATACSNCSSPLLLYDGKCYATCDDISLQYDTIPNGCVLCPDGCDTCTGTICHTCMSAYSLSSTNSQCVKTCLLDNSCNSTSEQVLPLPGLISALLWTAIVIVIHLISHKNYIPYSLIILSGVIEFVLIIAALSVSNSALTSTARLLATSSQQRGVVVALLGLSVACNYITNIIYIVIFIKYIKPLVSNPRQIDVISNVVALIIGVATNYRFALIAFARMFPKPNIYVEDPKHFSQVHTLCIVSIILDLFPLVACFLGLTMEQPKTTFFMLCIDIILIVILNVVLTLWFVLRGKSEQYYKDYVKKYHMEDQHNPTSEGLPNEKDISKANMVANESINYEDQINLSNLSQTNQIGDSYKKLTKDNKNIKSTNSILIGKQSSRKGKQTQFQRSDDWPGKTSSDADPSSDVNFEPNLKSKRSGLSNSAQKIIFNQTILSEGKSVDDNLSYKGKSMPNNFTKEVQPVPKQKKEDARRIAEAQDEGDLPDIDDNTTHNGRESIFQKKEKLIRPKRVGADKPTAQTAKKKEQQRSLDQPLKLMQKDKRIGYFESDAFESNADEQDLEEIIKQKVWQSTIRLEKPARATETNEETGYEEISPSWFNVQNQRMDISDYDESRSQE